ncbi:hypothetical protein MSAN_01805600 [Mycena sanguinolenta]|uniref:Uncharacterized protein n=1 Tax=Mycena sanguinolenta TaxID=230812 RepID=A0A8H7CTA9_9AGAR|nr:hypothetical protein MSAN_01805600 [Mycena sanguinolenta]
MQTPSDLPLRLCPRLLGPAPPPTPERRLHAAERLLSTSRRRCPNTHRHNHKHDNGHEETLRTLSYDGIYYDNRETEEDSGEEGIDALDGGARGQGGAVIVRTRRSDELYTFLSLGRAWLDPAVAVSCALSYSAFCPLVVLPGPWVSVAFGFRVEDLLLGYLAVFGLVAVHTPVVTFSRRVASTPISGLGLSLPMTHPVLP